MSETSPADEALMVLALPVTAGDFLQAGEASSRIKKVLQQLGIDPKIIRRVAIAAYEAEMNIVIHSVGGTIETTITPQDIILNCQDHGPGIDDIDLAMEEGYSTASEEIREMGFGAGMGLPNIKRSADEFAIESSPAGTCVRVRISHQKG